MAEDLPAPKSRKEEYLATAAGMTGIELPEPASREEIYLDAIAQGGGGGGSSYTAGDGIDITNNEISVDTETIQPKLTAGTNITIDQDNVISAEAGGGVKELTPADYDYPTDNPDGIALWNIEPGFYKIGASSVRLYLGKLTVQSASYETRSLSNTVIIMGKPSNSGMKKYMMLAGYKSGSSQYGKWEALEINGVTTTAYGTVMLHPTSDVSSYALTAGDVVDNLTANYNKASYVPLSAKQGKILNDKFGGMQLVSLTQAAYDALATKDPNTLYIITGA